MSIFQKTLLQKITSLDEKLMMTSMKSATSIYSHKDGNILDLVFANNPSLVHNTTIIPVL